MCDFDLQSAENPAICAGGDCTNAPGSYLCTCEGGLLPDPDGPGCLGESLRQMDGVILTLSIGLQLSPLLVLSFVTSTVK